jgi:UDP-N-acetylglucosamine diphosphorylase / glucose-1-phosphate thymidylyltransferase / UDP-N-acetylgalactosamine diphosphorylase / glucosamine-1-phosphate N-acetyltransferase / galactosamine-1-phosphate N-acetyltransferase
MRLDLEDYVPGIGAALGIAPRNAAPWDILAGIDTLIGDAAARAGIAARRPGEAIYIHPSATVEPGAVLKPPVLIGAGCFVAAHAYLRGGVLLGPDVTIGPGSEVKSSLVMAGSALAHFNFVGDSLIGAAVNLEAGAVLANRWNERADKTIALFLDGRRITVPSAKFGAIIGDGSRIGANAVLSPGTVLPPGSVVGRLQLVDQGARPT